ncbi:MAG: PEGA domain-containing protein [Myxococcales bacterium]|nr:PEGA domain-containing protein [Myxococcales bacterium]
MVVLEYRSAARGGQQVARAMARQIARQTSLKVISPEEAQRIVGAGLPAQVARCRGDASCTATIGSQIGADEVLLVGISQLGDLILAIQRIEVHTGRVLARLADSINPRVRVRRAVIDRYLRQLLPPSDFRRYGTIVVKSDADGDKIFIDDKKRGVTPAEPFRVPAPGRYGVRVKRIGHNDFVTRLDVLPEASVEVNATFTRIGGSGPLPWYKRWWVWAIIGAVVAGGATTVAVLTTTSPTDVDAVLQLRR